MVSRVALCEKIVITKRRDWKHFPVNDVSYKTDTSKAGGGELSAFTKLLFKFGVLSVLSVLLSNPPESIEVSYKHHGGYRQHHHQHQHEQQS